MNIYSNTAKVYFELVEKDANLIDLTDSERNQLESFKSQTIESSYMGLIEVIQRTSFQNSLFSIFIVDNSIKSGLRNMQGLNLTNLRDYIQNAQKKVVETGGLYLVVIPENQPDFFFIPTYRNDISIIYKDSIKNCNEARKLT